MEKDSAGKLAIFYAQPFVRHTRDTHNTEDLASGYIAASCFPGLNRRIGAGEQPDTPGPSSKGEILEDGKAYLGYAAAEAAALSPQGFVAAAGHDLGKQILGLCHTNHTAMNQFQAEQGSKVIHFIPAFYH